MLLPKVHGRKRLGTGLRLVVVVVWVKGVLDEPTTIDGRWWNRSVRHGFKDVKPNDLRKSCRIVKNYGAICAVKPMK